MTAGDLFIITPHSDDKFIITHINLIISSAVVLLISWPGIVVHT